MAKRRFARIFAALFHQIDKVMSALFRTFWIVLQTFAAGTPNPPPLPPPTSILLQSADGGRSWRELHVELSGKEQPISFCAAGGDLWMGTNRGLYHGSAVLPAPGWEKEFFPEEAITGIFPGQAGPYVLSERNGFFQKLPFTSLWLPLHNHLEGNIVNAVLESRNGALFVGSDSGIFKSVDAGNTWQQVFAGGLVSNLVEAGGVLIGGSSRGVLRSTDGGEHWELALSDAGAAFHVRHTDKGFAALFEGEARQGGERTRELFVSAGDGASWQRLTESLPAALRSIYTLEQAGAYLFACSDAGIFCSADGGLNWEQVRSVPPGGSGTFYKLIASGRAIIALPVQGC